jgi:hypothetical protein
MTLIATSETRHAARKVTIALADKRAIALAPLLVEIQASGITKPHAIAAELMRRGIRTAQGRRFWGSTQVRKVLERLDRLAAAGALGPETVAMAQETER